jgi:ATP-binding cassette subfamily B protein RaxB
MVVAHHGRFLGLAELRARFPQSGKGANLKQLMGYASALGLAGRPLRLELAELPKLARPCVLHWDLNHFVVLHRVHTSLGGAVRAITVLDPAVGRRRLAVEEVSRHFTAYFGPS